LHLPREWRASDLWKVTREKLPKSVVKMIVQNQTSLIAGARRPWGTNLAIAEH
jgi:hypothetical protein